MKRAFLCLFLTVALVGTAHAQSGLADDNASNFQGEITATADIQVLTTVIQRLVVTGSQALDFGFVTAPAAGSEDYDELQVGQFTITGEAGSIVSLSEGAGTVTTMTGGTGSVTWSPGSIAATTTLTGGSATIDLSGTLTVASGASGDFSGTYELDVAYTSI